MKKRIEITPEQKKIIEILCRLSDRDRFILQLRYGSRRSLRQVGKILSITYERIRALENRALENIDVILKDLED
jgi:RNA polymerase sigma factor (sigma-70 family)